MARRHTLANPRAPPGGPGVCGALVAALAVAHAVSMAAAQPSFGGLTGVPDKDFVTDIFLRANFRAEDYTLTPQFPVVGPGGTLSAIDIDNNRILGATPTAPSQFIYNLNPCGFVNPNAQPTSAQIVTPLTGTLDVGFVNELGTLIRNRTLESLTSFFIPQGVAGFIQNPACTPVTAIGAFSTPDPNFVRISTNFVNLPTDLIAALVPGLAAADVQKFRTDIITGTLPLFDIEPNCAARCGL